MESDERVRWRRLLEKELSSARQIHSEGVAQCARQLAKHWGADPDKAERAGWLHDLTKEKSKEEHFALFEQFSADPDETEQQIPNLWHAVSGAWLVFRCLVPNDLEIFSAIRWHTTGCPGMTLLDKILYAADFIEPNRNYFDVEFYRREAFRDLDNALRLGMRWNLLSLLEKQVPVHPRTVEAYNEQTRKQERNLL